MRGLFKSGTYGAGKRSPVDRLLSLMLSALLLTSSFASPVLAKVEDTPTFCGKEEHVHGDECYEAVLVCGKEIGDDAHTHSDECYTEKEVLSCGQTEHEAHAHDESCYGDVQVLACGLKEAEPHTHSDACYAQQPVLSCGRAEEEAHTHSDACYTERRTLACTEDHEHTDDCYTTETVLACGKAKTEGHSHSDACYTMEKVLVCGKAETEGHTHSAACYKTERGLVCGKAETPGHTHSEACYSLKEVLSCGQEENRGHEHGVECFARGEKLICGKEEHIHTLACYSDPRADVEGRRVWQRSVAAARLTGSWGHDLVEIAKTQIGYEESTRNYKVDANGNMHGYTRYGDWYGNTYGEWCAMFVSFCLNYAQIPTGAMPRDAGVVRWVKTLKSAGMYAEADGYTPKPGDLLFLQDLKNQNGSPVHVGIVTAVTATTVTTIEGNSGPVGYHSYKLSAPAILGYGILPQNPKYVPPVYVEEIPAACDTDGVKAHYADEGEDGMLYADEDRGVIVTEEELVIPAAHDWGEVVYTWSEDNSELTARRVCKADETHVEEETVAVVSTVTGEPEEGSEGEITYTSEAFENPAFEQQTKKPGNDIPASEPAASPETVTSETVTSETVTSETATSEALSPETIVTPEPITEADFRYTFVNKNDNLSLLWLLQTNGILSPAIRSVSVLEGFDAEAITLRRFMGDIYAAPNGYFSSLGLELISFTGTRYTAMLSYPAPAVEPQTLQPELAGETSIKLEGELPVGTLVTAEPAQITAELPVEEILLSYDITLSLEEEKIQPDNAVRVSFSDPAIAEALEAGLGVVIYHICEDGTAEKIPAQAEGDTVSFDARSFSSYAAAAVVLSREFTVGGETYRVTASYDYDSGIPTSGAVLSVTEVENDDPDAVSLDIKLVSETDESIVYQPVEGKSVSLSVVLLDEEAEQDGEVLTSIRHVREDGTEESINATRSATEEGYLYTFETGSFSTFTFYRTGTNSNERFITTIKYSRFSGASTELNGTAKIDNHDEKGWKSFDEIVAQWNSSYSYAGSNGRYSVLRANDNGNGRRNQALCAVGFFNATALGLPSRVALGRYATSADVNGSAASYDLQIELNDNSLPVRFNVNGTVTDEIFVPSGDTASYTADDIAAELGYSESGYVVASSKLNGVSVNAVNRVQLTETDVPTATPSLGWWSKLLAGSTFSYGAASNQLIAANVVSYPATNVSYPAAYKWTYDNGGTETVVGDTPYVIKLVPAVARVSNDGGTTWKNFACLVSGTYDGEMTQGAFDYANTLTGGVIVELLKETHERYTLANPFRFDNAAIDSLTLRTSDPSFKSVIEKDQTAGPLISTLGVRSVSVENLILDGKDKRTTNTNGGILWTDAAELTLSGSTFQNGQAGRMGGGVYHYNASGNATATVTKCTFIDCGAYGKDDSVGGGGGGLFTNALTLNVSGSNFTGCTTDKRQGAAIFHKRASDSGDSSMSLTGCHFEDCSANHGGAAESNSMTVTVEGCEFINCKGRGSGNGGGLNFWANAMDNPTAETTLTVTDCSFESCATHLSGGAIRSTAINNTVTGCSFTDCTVSSKDGGTLAFTNTNSATKAKIEDCTITGSSASGGVKKGGGIFAKGLELKNVKITGCSAEQGGAVYASNELTLESVDISDCSAEQGGAVYARSVSITDGSITGNTTTGTANEKSAAVHAYANKNPSAYVFSGSPIVINNVDGEGNEGNVYLYQPSDQNIVINEPLGDDAQIGVYVRDDRLPAYGGPGDPFGKKTTTVTTNLDKFVNDRNGLLGCTGTDPTKIYWSESIARVSNDGGTTWEYFQALTTGTYGNGVNVQGAFDYANTLSGDVIIETLKKGYDGVADDTQFPGDTVGRYTLQRNFTFDGVSLSSVTIRTTRDQVYNPTCFNSTIQRGYNGDSLITINGDENMAVENITFDGASMTGRAIEVKRTNASLTVKGGSTFRDFKVTGTSNEGGAIYSEADVKIQTNSGETVSFSNCSSASEGGAISLNQKKLTVENAGTLSFENCSGTVGGAICTDTAGEMAVANSGTLQFNNCTCSSGQYGGGAIWTGSFSAENNSGSLSFTNCSAANGGGAIYANRDAESSDTYVLTSTSTGTASFVNCSSGSAGGAIRVTKGKATITSENTASPIRFENCTSNKEGGAIYQAGGTTMTLENVTFGADGDAAKACAGTNGGAVYSAASGTVTMTNVKAYGKGSATPAATNGSGGAIYVSSAALTVNGGEFKDLAAKANGGAIYAGGSVSITGTAAANVVFENCAAGSNGGAIYQGGEALTLTNVTFGAANTPASGCTAALEGGCVYSTGSNAEFTDCNFYYGIAGDATKNVKSRGGAIYYKGSTSLSVYGCVFDHCSVQTASTNMGWGNGGAIFVDDTDVALTIDKSSSGRRSSFTDCFARRFGGAVMYEQNGGKSVSISSTDFTGCYTEYRGGGAVCPDSNQTTIDNCTFKECYDKSRSGGGAIQLHPDNSPGSNPSVSISNSTFEDCYTGGNGGAIYGVSGSVTVTLENVSINGHSTLAAGSNNAAEGSAVYSKGDLFISQSGTGKTEIKNCTTSTANAGAVQVYSGKTMTFEGDVVVYDNTRNGDQANVVLNQNNNMTINTSAAGLGANANIGIYVTGNMPPSESEPYQSHGGPGDPFGTYAPGGSTDNFDKFLNDRNGLTGTERTSATERLIVWENQVKVHEGEEFGEFDNQEDPKISRDSAYTVLFNVTGASPKLRFTDKNGAAVSVPANTTVIMRVNGDAYYYYVFNSAASEVALSSFSKMGGGTSSLSGSYSAQFIVDFSDASSYLSLEDGLLITTMTSGTGSGAVSSSGTVTLVDPAGFGLTESTDDTDLAETLSATSGAGTTVNGGRATIWDNREMALVIEEASGTVLPPDASLKVTIGTGAEQTVSRNASGKFIVPLGSFDEYSVQITLESDHFPRTATEYTLTAKLMVADSLQEGSPLNGHYHGSPAKAAATATLSFKSEATPQPSVKITTAKRAYQPGETVTFEIQTKNDEPYEVTATVYRKTGDSWTSTTVAQDARTVKAAEAADGTFTNVSFKVPASDVFESYKLVVTVVDNGGTTVLEVPYYYLAVSQK